MHFSTSVYTDFVLSSKELVLEKETRIKETMKMMGLSNWILTSTWYLKEMMFLFIPIVIITIFFKVLILLTYKSYMYMYTSL